MTPVAGKSVKRTFFAHAHAYGYKCCRPRKCFLVISKVTYIETAVTLIKGSSLSSALLFIVQRNELKRHIYTMYKESNTLIAFLQCVAKSLQCTFDSHSYVVNYPWFWVNLIWVCVVLWDMTEWWCVKTSVLCWELIWICKIEFSFEGFSLKLKMHRVKHICFYQLWRTKMWIRSFVRIIYKNWGWRSLVVNFSKRMKYSVWHLTLLIHAWCPGCDTHVFFF